VDAEGREHGEPGEHHRTKDPADESGALLLHHEQADQDDDGDRHHRRRQRWRIDLQAFDGAEHRNRRRDGAVAVEQRRADQADDEQLRAPGSRLGLACAKQRQDRDDPALSAIVCTQDQQRVFNRDDQDERPQDQRHHAENGVVRDGAAMGGGPGGFLQRVKGAGADVAIDDPEGPERGCEWKRVGSVAGRGYGHWQDPRTASCPLGHP
jgi:hypothetical protein